jgi:Mg2+/Co2+ transporter CorB
LIGSFASENTKIQNINSSVLGISFLIGVNIFILTSLKKEVKQKLFIESGLIFSISVILLLVVMFKVTNYMNIRHLMEDRISTQLVFNFAILLNMFVIINYIISVITKEKRSFLK